MNKNDLLKSISEQNRILHKVSENNTHEIKSTSRLKTLSLTLKVEETRLPKPNGVMPIIKTLQNISEELYISTKELVNKDRYNLRRVTKEIQYYSLEMVELIQSYNNYIRFIMDNDMKIEKTIDEFTEEDIKEWSKPK